MNNVTSGRPRGFRLDAAESFFAGFVPGSGMAAVLREEGDALVGEVAGTDDRGAVTQQVARILGLEGDAEA